MNVSALQLEFADGIALVTIDLPHEPVNKVTASLRAEFGQLFGRIETDPTLRGVVLLSGKSDTWIAGADVDEFLTIVSPSIRPNSSANSTRKDAVTLFTGSSGRSIVTIAMPSSWSIRSAAIRRAPRPSHDPSRRRRRRS
jgi:enoyl-CoA hydratase/carnithine racemase